MNLLQKVKHSFSNSVNANSIGNGEKSLEELSKSDFFLMMFDIVPLPIIYVSNDGHFCYVNKAYADWFDLNPEDIIGRAVKDFLGAEAYSQIKPHMDKALNGEQNYFEGEILYEQGKRFIDAIYTPVFDGSGSVKGYVALISDVTEKKETENELKRKQDELRDYVDNASIGLHRMAAIIQSSDDAIIGKNLSGIITSWNPGAQKLFGYTEEEMVGQPVTRLIPPDRLSEELEILTRLKRGETVDHFDTKRMTKDGRLIDISLTISPIKDSNGKIIGASKIARDITAKKLAEEQRAKLVAIIQSSDDAIISKNLNGIITSWNPGAQKLFGYTGEEMIGQPVTKLIPHDRLDEEPEILSRLKKGKTVDHFDTKRITKDGRLIDISLTISPIKDDKGTVIGASKIARDITLQKKLNEALLESEERLRMATETTQLGTWEFHPLTKKLVWSNECKKIYGVSPDFEPSSEFVAEHMYDEDKDYVQEEMEKIKKPGDHDNFQVQYRITRESDKQLRWVKVRGKVFFDAQQQPERFIGTMLDITEDKSVEQLLRENEERLRMAIESTRLGTWEYHPLTKEISCSEECRKVFGAAENIKPDNQYVFEHVHPDDRDFVRQEVKKAIQPGGTGRCEIEYRIIREIDAEIRWVKVQGKTFFNSQQQPERFIGTMLDITEDRQQKEELRESIELFQTMADNVPAMIWMSGTDKFDDYFNKTWLEFTGRAIEEECDEGWLEGLHSADIQTCIDTYNTSFKEQKGFYLEYRLRRYDGQYRWIADKSVPRYSPDGEFLGFISACIDIDDQKRFREKIQDSELLFKTISNASPAGLWLTDEDGQNVFVNETWINWTGKPLEQQLVDGWMGSVVSEDVEPVTNKFRQSFIPRNYFNTEFRFKKIDGQIRWGLAEGYPYFDINGSFAGYAGSITDITELKKLEQRKDDFIKMASHELKTPITSISGYVQLLLNIYNELDNERLQASKPTVKSSLNTISKQVAKLTRLISELLDLSKIESGKLELHKTEFYLADLVEETVQDVRHTTAKHAIIVNNDFDGKIYADKDRISQVILNLLTNAIKYSPDSDSVEVYVEGSKKSTTIRVKDHGIGIDKRDHQKIFERFYRVEGRSEQTYPGFGIGLFIASEIIHRHHGSISIESEKGKGSLFTVTLPIAAAEE